MRYSAHLALLLLLAISPHAFTDNRQKFNSDDTTSLPITQDDPEQLFVEALKIVETSDRAVVNKLLDEACRLWLKQGGVEKAARARVQIGDLYRNDKKFDEALYQYRQTLQIPNLGTSLKALTYDAIGQIYAELYQHDLAINNYRKALNLATLSHDYAVAAQVQLNLASLSSQQGDFGRALDHAERAVISSTKENDEKALASALGFQAQMEIKLGLAEKGRKNLDRAFSLYQRNNDLPAQIKTLCFKSALNLSENQIAVAREQAASALKMAEDLGQQATTRAQKLRVNALGWPCWLALARSQRASQQLEEARVSYFRAVSGTVLEWWLAYAVTEKSAIGFAEDRQAAYRELVDLLVESGKITEAYDVYQYAKLRTLSGYMRSRPVVNASVERNTGSQIGALASSIVALRNKLVSPTLSRNQREAFRQELSDLEIDLAEKRLLSELTHPKRRLDFSRPVSLKRVQPLLNDDESMVEFYLGESRSFVWLVTRQSSNFQILPGRREIEGKVRDYLTSLSKAPSNLHLQSSISKQRALGEELFNTLFGGLEHQLRAGSKLIVVTDGLLNHVPYESLVQKGHYLIEDYEVRYLPSASMLELLRETRAATDKVEQMDLLAFGDPDFQTQSRPAATRNGTTKLQGHKQQPLEWDFVKFSPLPRSREEVEFIASLIKPERKRLYLGKASTEKAFKQEPLKKYRWIHFATHSLIDEQNPDRSAVVLSLDGNNEEDGFLRVSEISELDLNSDLVILSACETGRGQLLSGEGIIGLSRSFFIAGTRSVMVSQWAVSDISTAQLMKDFYQQLVSGDTKPAALRAAKMRMIRGTSATRHPYYWAPFVIMGAP